MHEMSIARSLVDIIVEEMRVNHAEKLLTVRMRIGLMTAVVADSLRFCFEILTANTNMAGAGLVMDIIPVTGHCSFCDKDFTIEGYAFVCPSCGSADIETTGGRELSIVEIEVE